MISLPASSNIHIFLLIPLYPMWHRIVHSILVLISLSIITWILILIVLFWILTISLWIFWWLGVVYVITWFILLYWLLIKRFTLILRKIVLLRIFRFESIVVHSFRKVRYDFYQPRSCLWGNEIVFGGHHELAEDLFVWSFIEILAEENRFSEDL